MFAGKFVLNGTLNEIFSVLIHLTMFVHILLVIIPLGSAETNAIIKIVLNVGKFDIIPTDILFDPYVFGENVSKKNII